MSKIFVINAGKLAKHRVETLEGRTYYVAPTVMLTEGVFTANEGPLYYSPDAYGDSAPSWNNKPIVVYHPTDADGNFITASSAAVLEASKVGFLLNTSFDGRLTAEAWIDVEKANKVDSRICEFILNNTPMEVSTGMITDVIEEKGVYNGVDYVGKVANIRPDHFALLPDKKGACSLKDGAGLLVMQDGTPIPESLRKEATVRYQKMVTNQLSYDELREAIRTQLKIRLLQDGNDDCYCWIADVYQTYAIVEIAGHLWKIGYSISGDAVTLSGETPVEVTRVTEYRTLDGKMIVNQESSNPTGEKNVNKEQMIEKLIANGVFTENDREFLNGKSELQITGICSKLIANESSPPKQLSWEELLAAAPANHRAAIHNGIMLMNEKIAADKKTILEGTDVYTAEDLDAMDPIQLAKMAKLVSNQKKTAAAPTEETSTGHTPLPAYYGGAAGMIPHHFVANVRTGEATSEVLGLPSSAD